MRYYRCRFCSESFAKSANTYQTLYAHRDGAKTRPVCVKRHIAINQGFKLDPSWSEQQKAKQKQTNTLDQFVIKQPFGTKNMNLMLVIWILRHALPWARFEDTTLRATLWYSNPLATIYSSTWAAHAAQRLYIGLQKKALQDVLVSFLFLLNSHLFSQSVLLSAIFLRRKTIAPSV